MKATRIVTIICWAIAAAALVGLAIWFFIGSFIRFDSGSGFISFGIGSSLILTGPYEAAGTQNVPLSGIDSLTVDWISGDVEIKPYDGDEIKVTEYAQRTLKDTERMSVSTSGGVVLVKFTTADTVWRIPSKKLEILVPRPLCGNMNNLTADTTSGGINVSGITAVFIRADTVSGTVSLTDIKAREIGAESTSGTVNMSLAEAETIILDSTSGTLRLSDALSKTLRCGTTSGSINLSGAFDSVNLSSVSGTIKLNNSAQRSALYTETTSGSQEFYGYFVTAVLNSVSGSIIINSTIVPDSLITDTTSGDVTVKIPRGEITVNHVTTSGSFKSEIPVTTQNGNARFSFSSTSGDVRIIDMDMD